MCEGRDRVREQALQCHRLEDREVEERCFWGGDPGIEGAHRAMRYWELTEVPGDVGKLAASVGRSRWSVRSATSIRSRELRSSLRVDEPQAFSQGIGGGFACLSLRLGIALPDEREKVQSTHHPRLPMA